MKAQDTLDQRVTRSFRLVSTHVLPEENDPLVNPFHCLSVVSIHVTSKGDDMPQDANIFCNLLNT